MKTQTQELRYYIATPEELTPADATLVEAAKAATYNSYSPYSHFSVGAAVRLENGEIVQGSNQENAAYSPTNCAERTAMFKAVYEGERQFDALAIVWDGENPAVPCGVCRQVLAEFCDPEMPVICANRKGEYKIFAMGDLLPDAFLPEDLKK